MSLLSPGTSASSDATPQVFFEMLNKACALRHINARSSIAGCETDRMRDSCKDDSGQPHVEIAGSVVPAEAASSGMASGALQSLPQHADDDLNKVLSWMADSDRKHERTTAVLRCCLEFFALYLSSQDEQKRQVCAEDLLSSSLLPLLEENLAVGIEDMENEASLFRHTISLVYQLSQMGDDSAKVLGPIGKQWKPAQRRSLMQMCDDVDKLVAEYLEGVGHNASAETGNSGHGESFFEMVRFVAGCVRQATAQGIAPQDAEAAANVELASDGKVAAWRMLPSVITWLPGKVVQVDEAILDEVYEKDMSAHKLEGLEGVRDSHHWKSYGTGKVMPTRMARKVMQELVALRRDLPLNRREGVVLRYDEERADYIKIVIFGSEDTPYAAGCFEYHIYCPPTYPDVAPSVWLMTTGNGRVRFNPNLYEDGLVCSSLLNQGSGWGHVT
jgi:ubiquitin-protein ligase